MYRLATPDETSRILGSLAPLSRGWKVVRHYPGAGWLTEGRGYLVRQGWMYGTPYDRARTEVGSAIYSPYIHIFSDPPVGSWRAWDTRDTDRVSIRQVIPVGYRKHDVVAVGYMSDEPTPVLVVRKVLYPDPTAYFASSNSQFPV